ncbi:MAG: hypothetical protein IKL82_05615 [Clostridia bacterium]|nr:hypothetical protein [Clostridia bacterium]
MNEIIKIISDVLYVIFILSSVTFGVSLAVRTLLVKTVKSVVKESDKNFDKIEDYNKKSKSLEAIENAKIEYLNYLYKSSEIKKRNDKNRVKKLIFKKEIEVEKIGSQEDIFLSLFKNVAGVYSENGSYLSFSKNEIVETLLTLTERLKTILDKTSIIWLKGLNVSVVLYALSIYKRVETFKGNGAVFITLKLLDFCLKVSKLFSPVGASNNLLTSAVDGGISNLISTAVIEVVGKEIASLYSEKQKLRTVPSKKTA